MAARDDDPSLPPFGRVKFLAISAQSLDPLFRMRVTGLKAPVAARVAIAAPDGESAEEQRCAIRPQDIDLMEIEASILWTPEPVIDRGAELREDLSSSRATKSS